MSAHTPDDPEGEARSVFAREVPEIAAGVVIIRALARERGLCTKVAIDSDDPEVDFMGAVRGDSASRIRNISNALGGEAIHLAMWSAQPELMVRRALAPVQVASIEIDESSRQARVTIPETQPPKVHDTLDGQRELASRLSGWDIAIVIDPELG